MLNEPALAVAIFIFVSLAISLAFYWGYQYGKYINNVQSAYRYLQKHFPNEWTAYKRGISEGYNQGLRDGQDHLE